MTIRIFVGTCPASAEADQVLRDSIDAHTSAEYELIYLRAGDPPWDDWVEGVMPYAYFKWAIPAFCDYEGFAIYLNTGCIVLGDIAELWEQRQEGKWLCARSADVSVIDCAAFADAEWSDFERLRAGEFHKNVLPTLVRPLDVIDPAWNRALTTDDAKLLHFEAIDTKPWRPLDHIDYRPHPDYKMRALWEQYREDSYSPEGQSPLYGPS